MLSSINKKLIYIILVLFAAITLFPIVWMFLTSLKLEYEIYRFPPTFFPEEITLSNYREVLKATLLPLFYFNSIFIAVMQVSISVLLGALAGYGFAKKEFPGRDAIFVLLLSGMMLPLVVLIIPNFITICKLGLINTLTAQFLPWASHPFGVFLMRQYIKTIPSELEDAARMDGSSELGIFFRIILPLSMPACITLGILNFMWDWKALLWPLIVVSEPEKMPLPLGLLLISGRFSEEWGRIMAAGFLSIIPVIGVFIAGQKRIVGGLTRGAIK